MPSYWKAVRDFRILHKRWAGESVIYHTGSGDTQLMDTVGIVILDFIQSTAVSTEDILGHIKAELNIDVDEAVLMSVLSDFSRSGVIRRSQT